MAAASESRSCASTSSEVAGGPRTTHPPPSMGWWMVAVLFFTALLSYTDRLVLSVLVDPLRRSFGLSDTAVSLLQGVAFTLVYVFASLPMGRLADRHRRRTLLIAGASLWCAATIACGLAPGFWTLFSGRLLIGIGEATLVPAAVSMIADSFPPERLGTAVGTFAMGTVIGGPLGISAGGLLLAAAKQGTFSGWPLLGSLEPWRLVLVALGLLGLLSPLLLLTVREPNRLKSGSPEISLRAVVHHFTQARRQLVPLYLAMALLSIGDYGLLSWAPATLSRVFGWPASEVGVLFGIITAIAGVAGALGGGWISDVAEHRGSTRARLSVCLTAALIAAAAAAAISAPFAYAVLAGIAGWVLFSSVGGIGGVAALQEVMPDEHRATSMSLLTFCNTLIGLGCGPTVIALTTQYAFSSPRSVGFAISMVVVPAAIIAAAAFSLTRRKMRERTVAPMVGD